MVTSLVPGVAYGIQLCQNIEVCGFLRELDRSAWVIPREWTVSLGSPWYHYGCSWYHYGFPSSPCTLLVVVKAGCMLGKDRGGTDSAYLVIRDGVGQFLDEPGQSFGVIGAA